MQIGCRGGHPRVVQLLSSHGANGRFCGRHKRDPRAARDFALDLLLIGFSLSRSPRFAGEEQALLDIWPLPERLQHPDWYRNVTLLLAVRQVPVSSSLEMSRVPELIGLFSVHSREGPVLIDGALEVAASSISARSHRGRASVERLSHAALLSRQCCIEEMYEARDSVFYLRAKLCGRDVSVMVPTPRSLFCAPVTLLLRANLLVARSRQIQLPCAALASDDANRARFLGPYRLRVICCAAIAPASQVTARASAARSVHVTTSDGEVFPVHRTLLRSCIALTKAVRDTQSAQPEVAVDVDCATFDRVLLFLEAASRLQQRGGSGGAQGDGRQAGGTQAGTQAGTEAGTEAGGGESSNLLETFAFDMHTLPSLSLAAKALGCRLLRECCEKRLGAFEERIGMHRWHEVVATNEKGGCMVTMDGMVFDLLAWLPEHPGGSTIIPQQALNVDCTVFFELYHASRESFTCKKSGLSDRTNPLLLPQRPRPALISRASLSEPLAARREGTGSKAAFHIVYQVVPG